MLYLIQILRFSQNFIFVLDLEDARIPKERVMF